MKLSSILLALTCLCAFPLYASDTSSELELVKKELKRLQEKLARLEQAEAQRQKREKKQQEREKSRAVKAERVNIEEHKGETRVYASLRPTFGREDKQGEGFTDVQDALSNIGFKSSYEFKQGWKAIAQGEWSVDMGNNGDFGKARQVYVALDAPFGQIGIGKQRPVHYSLIAEYVDIFNHRSSPFAYDPEGPFFVNNMLTYQKQFGSFKFMLTNQYDGPKDEGFADFQNIGVSYDNKGLHLAIAHWTRDAYSEDEVRLGKTSVRSGSVAKSFDNGFYAAVAYQDFDYDFATDRNGHTLDISLAYRFAPQFRLKTGYFELEDGKDKQTTLDHDGANLTLEWLPADSLRFHIEYLMKNYDELENDSSLSIGFRYDYAKTWQF